MRSRKGDISVNTIVYVAIAVFVLIIIIGFATGTFQNLISGIWSPSEVDNAKTECDRLCKDAEFKVDSSGIGEFKVSEYCTKKFSIDVNENKVIDPKTEVLGCGDAPISKICKFDKQVADGTLYSCTYTTKTKACDCVLKK